MELVYYSNQKNIHQITELCNTVVSSSSLLQLYQFFLLLFHNQLQDQDQNLNLSSYPILDSLYQLNQAIQQQDTSLDLSQLSQHFGLSTQNSIYNCLDNLVRDLIRDFFYTQAAYYSYHIQQNIRNTIK